jgi:hypothetical protein
VKQAGYLPFRKGLPADHRCSWADFVGRNLLSNNLDHIQHSKQQRLQCRNPSVRGKFETMYTSFMEEHSMLDRVRALASTAGIQAWNGGGEEEWEALDLLRQEGVYKAT